MAVQVHELLPGDVVVNGPRHAVHIAHLVHPYWPHLQLVIWRMDDRSWSHDALDARQEVGDLVPQQWEERRARLLEALTGEPG